MQIDDGMGRGALPAEGSVPGVGTVICYTELDPGESRRAPPAAARGDAVDPRRSPAGIRPDRRRRRWSPGRDARRSRQGGHRHDPGRLHQRLLAGPGGRLAAGRGEDHAGRRDDRRHRRQGRAADDRRPDQRAGRRPGRPPGEKSTRAHDRPAARRGLRPARAGPPPRRRHHRQQDRPGGRLPGRHRHRRQVGLRRRPELALGDRRRGLPDALRQAPRRGPAVRRRPRPVRGRSGPARPVQRGRQRTMDRPEVGPAAERGRGDPAAQRAAHPPAAGVVAAARERGPDGGRGVLPGGRLHLRDRGRDPASWS